MPPGKSDPELWSALGFYGTVAGGEVIQACYHSCIEWCQEIGCQPAEIAVIGPEFPKGRRDFIRASKTLAKAKFRGVTGIEIDVMSKPGVIPGGEAGRDVGLYIATKYSPSGDSYALVIGDPLSLPWNTESLLPISERIIRTFKPEYGIGFRDKELPGFYIIGLSAGEGVPIPGSKEYEAALAISRWGYRAMKQQVWREGALRDVYPWSFLNRAQLLRKIEGVSLKNWILQDPSRGSLSRGIGDLNLWQVEEAKTRTVRKTLDTAQILFQYK